MRVLMVLLAVMVTPLVAIGAQGNSDHNCEKRSVKITNPRARERALAKCDLEPPPPPPPPPSAGTSGLEGWVFEQAPSGRVGIAGWTVTLSGSASASTVTNAQGNWAFTGLAGGDYTICVVLPSGWSQTSPTSGASCPGGTFGYSYSLPDDMTFGFIWFGNMWQ